MNGGRGLLVLWLTGRCNLRCRYCYAAAGPSGDMDLETAVQAIEWMGEEPFTLQFAGGEPLLNLPLLEELLEYARRKKPQASCALQTNATLIDDRAAGLLREYGVAVGVSMDGKPQRNEAMRGKTREALEGVRTLGENGVTVNLNAVVTAKNAAHLDELVDVALYLGNVGGIGLDLLRCAGRAREGQASRASGEELEEGLRKLKRRLDLVNRLSKRRLTVREFEKARRYLEAPESGRAYCYASLGRALVTLPGGDCYPCGSLVGQEAYYMGNVHNTVRMLPIRCERPAGCASCAYGAACPGGCPSRGILCGGFDELDCLMKKITFQLVKEEGT